MGHVIWFEGRVVVDPGVVRPMGTSYKGLPNKKLGTSLLVRVWQCVRPLRVRVNEILLYVYKIIHMFKYFARFPFKFVI